VVVLIWVYYTSQIILMGAEVTHAYAKHESSISSRGRALAAKSCGPRSRTGLQEGTRNGVLVGR
jgi:membrane protein